MWHLAAEGTPQCSTAPEHDEFEFQDCRGWSMRHHHRKRLLKPKTGKAALRAEIQGQGKEVLRGRSAFKRSIRSGYAKDYSHKLNKAPLQSMRRKPRVKARRYLHNVARSLQREETLSRSSLNDGFSHASTAALEEHGLVFQDVFALIMESDVAWEEVSRYTEAFPSESQYDSEDSASKIDLKTGKEHVEMSAGTSEQEVVMLEEQDAASRSWRRRCRRRAWWLQDFRPIIGTRVKLVGCNLVNPCRPSATSGVVAKGTTLPLNDPKYPGWWSPYRRSPPKGVRTSSNIVVKGSLGYVHGMLPDGGVTVTFSTCSKNQWRIPPELFVAFRSLQTLDPGRCVRHHKFGSSITVSQQDESIVFRVDGATGIITDHVGSVLPLGGMAKTLHIGDCLATSEKALLRSKEKSLLQGKVPRGWIYLHDDGREILDGAADSRIIVELCACLGPGVVRVKPCNEPFSFKPPATFLGVWRPEPGTPEGWWPYEVPVSALHPQQVLVLMPQCTALDDGRVRITFATMSGAAVAAGLEVTITGCLPKTFWCRVFAQAKLSEERIAVALPDGRIRIGRDIRLITFTKDILAFAN
jgi:hypothetical protein